MDDTYNDLYPLQLKDPEIPVQEDCSNDTVPAGTTNMEGKKKVLVPELITMTKVLFDRYRLDMYTYLNNCLHTGGLAAIVGKPIKTRVINHEICTFPGVTYWRIDRANFLADVTVELKLQTSTGLVDWRGCLTCWCGFDDNGLFFSIEDLDESLDRKDEGLDMLSPYLVPYATNKRVDEISEALWKKYLPEALDDPKQRIAAELVKRMGLTIEFHPVYEHRNVESIIFFKKDELAIGEDRKEKDANGKERHIKARFGKPVVIPANTIVINTNKIHRDYSAFNIYHECYHYEEHYLFFCLQEMGSNDVRQVKTREVIVDKAEEVKDPIYFIEKQANRGGYGLMMPATDTRKQIAELCRKVHGYRHAGEKFEMVGKELARDLHMPHFRIRARMIQLGNIEAKGALNYVARELIEPFAFNTDSWREEQHTFVVDETTVKNLQKKSPDLRTIMESGKYVYADGHVVRNEPEYVEKRLVCNEDDPEEKEKLVLTGWANAHVDDCCLRFVRLYVQQNVGRYVYGRLYYDAALVKQEEFYLSDLINERQLSVPDAKYEYKRNFPESFREAFELLLHKNGETQETLAEKLNTTDRSIREWIRDPEKKISIDFVVTISLMWKLPDWISKMLLESAGKTLNERDRRHRALTYILDIMWDQGVEAANQYLTSQGLPILTI